MVCSGGEDSWEEAFFGVCMIQAHGGVLVAFYRILPLIPPFGICILISVIFLYYDLG